MSGYEKGAGFRCYYTLDLMKENILRISSLSGILLSAVPLLRSDLSLIDAMFLIFVNKERFTVSI